MANEGFENKELLKPTYVLAVFDGPTNEGNHRSYVPVLAEKRDDFYNEYQCSFLGEGTLADLSEKMYQYKKKDEESGLYVSVLAETPQQHASRCPKDKVFLLPEGEEIIPGQATY